jgi:hypothetical protein
MILKNYDSRGSSNHQVFFSKWSSLWYFGITDALQVFFKSKFYLIYRGNFVAAYICLFV